MKSTIFLILSIFVAISRSSCVNFSNFPSNLPPNVPSIGVQAYSMNLLGNQIQFSPYQWTNIQKIDVIMSSWSPYSEWSNYTCDGYNENITIFIYDSNLTLLHQQTQEFLVPWRPESNSNCSGSKWMDVYGNCWSGLAFEIEFPISVNVSFPPEIVYAMSYNTENYGFNPYGISGPYNSLNMGLTTDSPSVGEYSFPGYVYLNSSNANTYGDGGMINVFRLTNGFSPYQPIVRFEYCNC